MKTYPEVLKELKEANIRPLDGTEFYDFTDLPYEKLFIKFFEFGQTYLERNDLGFKISPALLYFNTSTAINAAARPINNYKLIEIYKGAIIGMYKIFDSFKVFFTNDKFSQLNNILYKRNSSPSFYMFQMCALYFFYHEVGHLIQGRDNIDEANFIEFIHDNNLTDSEISIRHMREFDADWFATQALANHTLLFDRENNKTENSTTLIDIAGLTLSAVFIFHVMQSPQNSNIYYKAHSHPHPSVRLSYMLTFMLEGMNKNVSYDLDLKGIFRKTINICNELLESRGEGFMLDYSKALLDNSKEISSYVNAIISDMKTYPALCLHKLEKIAIIT